MVYLRRSCLWAGEWLGVNASHPAAQAYYDSRVELLAELGVDLIKADCMMCQPCAYSRQKHAGLWTVACTH